MNRKLGRGAILCVVMIAQMAATPASLHAEGIRCWIRCNRPPDIKSSSDLPCALRRTSNPPLKLIARSTGILTTYLGKWLGIQGWRDYHLPATVTGEVVHAAGSTDAFYTIDVKIESLRVAGKQVQVIPGTSFIRIEVLPRARFGAPLRVCPDQPIRVSGKLMWDADGFLEIHPTLANDIQTSYCSKR